MSARGAAFALAFGGCLGCAELPDVPRDRCGNGVVELATEDCDTFAPERGMVCRPVGTSRACHLDCTAQSDGSRARCPDGWGCDVEGVCRAPTDEFDAPVDYTFSGIDRLQTADFDGDGRADLLSQRAIDAYGLAPIRFHYFDDRAALVLTRDFPKAVATPTVADLDEDGRDDLVFSNLQVGVMLGRADRTWVPETFSSYRIADAGIRIIGVSEDFIQNVSPLVTMSNLDGVPGIFAARISTGKLARMATVDRPVEDLAGDPVHADVITGFTSPCHELVFAYTGDDTFSLVDVCTRTDDGTTVWRDEAVVSTIALDPPGPIDSEPIITDLDGDGALDVMIGVAGAPYAAYGDGAGLGTARPYLLDVSHSPAPDISADIATPLAVGDVSGDGFPDFVFPGYIITSRPSAVDGQPVYEIAAVTTGVNWTVARIADLNGNGKLDIVAASSDDLGIMFYTGTGSRYFVGSELPTDGPVRRIAIGDYDGDQVNDLAFVEGGEGERDALQIAFGAPDQAPLEARPIARLDRVEQLSDYRFSGFSSLTISAREEDAGHEIGTLTVVIGSPDRIPFAPHALVSFSDDGSLLDASALGLTVGKYGTDGQSDVLALSTNGRDDYRFWTIPEIETGKNTPSRLASTPDPRFIPIANFSDRLPRAALASLSADFDGDGRDEALWVLPSLDTRECGLIVMHGEGEDGRELEAKSAQVLSTPCLDPVLGAADLDRDGALDVLLAAEADDGTRLLQVLWGVGDGTFSEVTTPLSEQGDRPRAFTVLPETPARPLTVIYVGKTVAKAREATAGSRVFSAPSSIPGIEHGTGIVAADLDGDGALDLAVSDSGILRILKARLRAL